VKRITVAALLAALLLLIIPTVVSAAGVIVEDKTGDGIWTDDTWEVYIYPGESKATTVTLYNSSSISLGVEAVILPDTLDDGNLTFDLDKSSFTMPGLSHTNVTLTVEASGSTTPGTYTARLEIKSEESPPPLPPPPPTYTTVNTDFCGETGTFQIDSSGRILQSATMGCVDGPLTITIEENTIAFDSEGNPLSTLSMSLMEDFPPPPEDNNIIGIPFNLGPDGATFDPSLTFTWTYTLGDLPEGVAEEDLVLAYYNTDTGEWITLDCVVDTENMTITASVSHFTAFALLCPIPEPEVAKPTKPPYVPPVPPEEEDVEVVEEPELVEVIEPVVEEPVEEEEIEVVVLPDEKPLEGKPNWIPLALAAVGVIVIWLTILFIARKRRQHTE